jgi:hypothetical protein
MIHLLLTPLLQQQQQQQQETWMKYLLCSSCLFPRHPGFGAEEKEKGKEKKLEFRRKKGDINT